MINPSIQFNNGLFQYYTQPNNINYYNFNNKNNISINNIDNNVYNSKTLPFTNFNQSNISNFKNIPSMNNNQIMNNNNLRDQSSITPNNTNLIPSNEKIINEQILKNQINKNKKPCGIINYGNNCYLNSGLQILSSCNKLVEELNRYKDLKDGLIGLIIDAFYKIFRDDIYDPFEFSNYFCKLNKEAFNSQYCSQNFIRKLLKNINDELLKYKDIHYITEFIQYKSSDNFEIQSYNKFLQANKFFPQSNALNLFTIITKSHSQGKCKFCNNFIEDFSYSYFIDQNIYLDNIQEKSKFSEILYKNIKSNNLTMNCKYCNKEITINEEIRYIKLPEILIFTLERYQEKINNVEIIPDKIIEMGKYIDKSVYISNTKYSLFAINIRYGSTRDFGHEICQIERNSEWYEINDTKSYIRQNEHNKNIHGLFYKRLLS